MFGDQIGINHTCYELKSRLDAPFRLLKPISGELRIKNAERFLVKAA